MSNEITKEIKIKNMLSFKNSSCANEFAKELWTQINIFGLLNDTKADICDYLLYLLDKHAKLGDNSNFLNQYSNEELSRMLKMSISKVKSTKKNIACKFMDDDEYNDIFNTFLLYIKHNDKHKIMRIENDMLSFTIDNPAMKSCVEDLLKKATGETFEYTLNSEKVKINANDFIKMLLEYTNDDHALFNKDELESALSEVKCQKNNETIKNVLKTGVKIIAPKAAHELINYLIK